VTMKRESRAPVDLNINSNGNNIYKNMSLGTFVSSVVFLHLWFFADNSDPSPLTLEIPFSGAG